MSRAEACFTLAAVLAGAAFLAGLALPRRPRVPAVSLLTLGAAAASLAGAVAVLAGGQPLRASFPELLPFAGVRLVLDPLGALFVVAVAVVAIPASLYAVGYCRGTDGADGLDGRFIQAVYPLFVASMLAVPLAASASTLLLFWELMALASLVLLQAEHRRNPAVGSAARWYGAMTHGGFVAILLAFLLLASVTGGADSFAAMRNVAAEASPLLRSVVFVVALVGFGAKAGAVPLHVWLPRAHAEAPSHISALMSGAMVKLGVYGIVRMGWDLLGGGPRWWGMVVLAVGAASALFGILHALVATDLKRLLAYSTTENVGLILMGLGAAGLFAASGNHVLAAVATGAAFLHVVNHSIFKGLLFLTAGSVVRATGTRDLDKLGGLARRMPVTAGAFAVGALAIAAFPPLNGFVSEWLLLQALVHSLPATTSTTAVLVPCALAIVALTGGLAAVTFVKAFGTGFLALPRSAGAAQAREAGDTMQAAAVLLAGLCLLLGVAPALLGPLLDRAVAMAVPLSGGQGPVQAAGPRVELVGLQASLSPLLLAVGLAVVLGLLAAAGRLVRSPGTVRGAATWGCGRDLPSARSEYTATSYAEPLQRVFGEVLRPEVKVDAQHRPDSRYYLDGLRYQQGIRDAFDHWLYRPVLWTAGWWGETARRVQGGSIHRYLAYAMAAFLAVLVVAQ